MASMTEEYYKKSEELEKKSIVDNTDAAGQVIGGIGGLIPFIKINDYGPFSTREVKKFNLTITNFYPTCYLMISTNSGRFLSTAFPKDGDTLNVFIRSYKNEFIPIRLDFLITNVSSMMSKDAEGDLMKLQINGVLKIPTLYAEVCDVVKNKTSYEALFDIATKLKLGFATNTKKAEFQDVMNWISPYFTNLDWIKDIASHAYIDDISFFDIWIDQYLNLNFANLNKNMSASDKIEIKDGIIRSAMSNDHGINEKNYFNKGKIILTNERSLKTTNYYFDKFSIENNAGTINLVNGYIRHLYWYNKLDEKVWDWEIKPIITANASNEKVVMLGRANEDFWKDEIKYKYAGLQYSLPDHNVHAYWKHAKYQNFQNLQFISKIKITLNLPTINYNLYRGQIIPVNFILTQQEDRIKYASKKIDDAENVGMSIDRFLSGNYTILGITYIWKISIDSADSNTPHGDWSQEIIIGRREWTIPDQHPIKPNEVVGSVEAAGPEIAGDVTRATVSTTK